MRFEYSCAVRRFQSLGVEEDFDNPATNVMRLVVAEFLVNNDSAVC